MLPADYGRWWEVYGDSRSSVDGVSPVALWLLVEHDAEPPCQSIEPWSVDEYPSSLESVLRERGRYWHDVESATMLASNYADQLDGEALDMLRAFGVDIPSETNGEVADATDRH
jgi:hypothetical protein